VTAKFDSSTTAPPPPPWGHHDPASPAPPLLPPPTTKTLAFIAPVGTSHSHVPTVVNVRTVSPLDAVVGVGLHAAAFAGTGIETNKPEIKVATTIETIFGRKKFRLMRTKSRIIFTSLFSIKRERLKSKSGVIGHL
jgi:hypothetical protein